jgi:hypothetical protein
MHSARNKKWIEGKPRVVLLTITLFLSLYSLGQYRDSNFIDPYTHLITGRMFLSQKYTLFAIDGKNGYRDIEYRPNTNLSLGVGATYRALTFNFGYGFKFMNPDTEKGDTKYLDLQTHLYGIKWRFDMFGQIYKGYYIYPKGYGSHDGSVYYYRPDLKVNDYGLSASYIFNYKRFSYRSAFLQSEWQKKSSGSFMLGGSMVYGQINADSAFVPAAVAPYYEQRDVTGMNYFAVGPGIGYAYTLVVKQHWFVTASLTTNLDLAFLKEKTKTSYETSVHFNPNLLFRTGFGYSSATWNANVTWVASRTAIKGQFLQSGYHVNSGNYRFAVSKRLTAKGGLRRFWINWIRL